VAARKPVGPPRAWSLVGRLTGGVVLIALLSFAAQALVLSLWLRPVVAESAAAAAEQALLVRTALQAVPAAQRQALAQRLSNPQASVSAAEPPDEDSKSLPAMPEFRPVEDMLQREGIEARLERRRPEGGAIVFRLPVEGQAWWLVRHFQPPPTALTGTLTVWLVLLAVVTLSALLVSVRLIARPIGELARALAAQQGTLRPLPLRGDASAELQALIEAFNRLAHQNAAAAQARQQLLAGVSHDLRTPLARLRLRAETQCEPALAEALTADLLALERIVNQFLAYVQGDTGAALGEPVPLTDSVRTVLHRYANQDPSLSLDLDEIEQPAPDLAVQRLLANLIDNALAYGGAPVGVALRATDAGAELRVSDGGPGMNEEEFLRAQLPFVRLTRTRSELGHCGLGLAIVAQVARQLGGRLQVAREADGRFAIVFSLPR
jgi:two-component system, OmpR family, osmolarity sensor histidine kinase EnvZ